MVQPIKVHALDTSDDAVRQRHADIEKRLDELGKDQVRMMMLHGGLPMGWEPVVHAWLTDDKLQPAPKADDPAS